MEYSHVSMSDHITTSRLANALAREVCQAFDQYQTEFRQITSGAARRFASRDWQGLQADSAARLEVYQKAIDPVVARAHIIARDRVMSHLVWVSTKAVYSGLIHDRDDWEIAETFFNSVTRRIFTTVGVDEEIEFVHTDFSGPPNPAKCPAHHSFVLDQSLESLLYDVFRKYTLPLDDTNLQEEAKVAAKEIRRRLAEIGRTTPIERIDMLKAPFYRGEHVHLIGRMAIADKFTPLVLSLSHDVAGVFLAAVLVQQDDVSLLFSYTRSYFFVEADRPSELVSFIKSIIPKKPTAEIYISIGYNRHGKTELYRHALRHLARSSDKYQLARGQRGMVMVVFTMPSYPVVFKIIKDEFDYPKNTSRQAVIDRYHLVFRHDRAGRLIDAQEYEYLTLDRARFDDDLLAELLNVARETVSVAGQRVVIRHCYAERRVTPLNIYLQENNENFARAAVIDYGQAIKDLALTNIFPGDLMLKNFGLTRQNRVVCYDYDEVCLLTDCTFRQLPQTEDYDEVIADEPWFAVGACDVFPEEFNYFLGFPPSHEQAFFEYHADLLSVDYWRMLQQQLRAGKLFHVPPYAVEKAIDRREWQAYMQRYAALHPG
jgi:isocitrate dehydrogenase kinase/phosphatase